MIYVSVTYVVRACTQGPVSAGGKAYGLLSNTEFIGCFLPFTPGINQCGKQNKSSFPYDRVLRF